MAPGLRKITPGKISFPFDWPLSERKGHKMLAGPLARRWCKPLRPFCIHLYEAPDFDKGQVCWPHVTLYSISMYNKKYISKPEIKKTDQFLERLVSRVWSFLVLSFSGWIPIWSVEAHHVYLLALASKTHARGHRHPLRISFKYEGEIKSFTDKQKLREFTTTKPALQQMLKNLL